MKRRRLGACTPSPKIFPAQKASSLAAYEPQVESKPRIRDEPGDIVAC